MEIVSNRKNEQKKIKGSCELKIVQCIKKQARLVNKRKMVIIIILTGFEKREKNCSCEIPVAWIYQGR